MLSGQLPTRYNDCAPGILYACFEMHTGQKGTTKLCHLLTAAVQVQCLGLCTDVDFAIRSRSATYATIVQLYTISMPDWG